MMQLPHKLKVLEKQQLLRKLQPMLLQVNMLMPRHIMKTLLLALRKSQSHVKSLSQSHVLSQSQSHVKSQSQSHVKNLSQSHVKNLSQSHAKNQSQSLVMNLSQRSQSHVVAMVLFLLKLTKKRKVMKLILWNQSELRLLLTEKILKRLLMQLLLMLKPK